MREASCVSIKTLKFKLNLKKKINNLSTRLVQFDYVMEVKINKKLTILKKIIYCLQGYYLFVTKFHIFICIFF